ncbi:MAG: hypothetical protein HRU40_00675 [Saprospiraceae bacterium]|nr:hypothetical protein [Saprospiraceae bacterium]
MKAESASSYSYTVAFVDAEQGHLVTTYELELFYKDNDPANGDNSFGPILFKTFTASDFTTNSNGFRTVTVTVKAAEMTSAIGLSFVEMRAGDELYPVIII